MVRGKSVAEALDALKFVPNRGARFLEKVLRSCAANAENKEIRNVDNLSISECRVDGGPMFKRIQPRARGMAYLVRHRTSHIHVAIETPDYAD